MVHAYRIILKLLPAEPHCTWEYLVIAKGSSAALQKAFKAMGRATRDYVGQQTMQVESLERVDATVVR